MQSPHPRAGQHDEGKERLVAALKRGCAGHLVEGVAALFGCWENLFAGRMGNARILGVQIEIISVGIGNARLVTRLPRPASE